MMTGSPSKLVSQDARGTGELQREIQGLRGVAVLLVVLYHAGVPLLPGGFVGVDVFFVISGYLITGLLVRELEAHGRIDFLRFLARRARRLLPAAITLVVVVVLISLFIYPPLERTDIVLAARAASLYAANLWFALRAVDYLGGHAAVNPMLHMWSLGVEEQFYLFWPLMVSLTAIGLRMGNARVRIGWMIVAVTIVSYLACRRMTWVSQPWAFFGTPFRAWEFGLGALVYLARSRLRCAPASLIAGVGMIGAAAIAASALIIDQSSPFPDPWALLPVSGTALVLAALQPSGPRALHATLAFRPLARVGDVSYSWYLWHWPLLVMAPVLHPQGGPIAVSLAVLLSYVAAEVSYRWIEQPFRTGRAAHVAPRLVVTTALATTVLTAGTLTLAHYRAEHGQVSIRQQLFIDARKDTPAAQAPGCHVNINATEVTTCISGDKDADRTIVLLGDSHAQHWLPALGEIGKKQGWQILSMTKSACPWVDTPVQVQRGRFLQPYPECEKWRTQALRRVVALKPAVIVLASGSRYNAVSPGAWEAGARRSLAALLRDGIRLVIVRDTPWPEYDVPTCLARAEQRGAAAAVTCSFDQNAGLGPGGAIFDAERRAAANLAAVSLVDLSTHLCPQGRCEVLSEGIVHFSDHSHLTATYSRSLAGALRDALQPVLGVPSPD